MLQVSRVDMTASRKKPACSWASSFQRGDLSWETLGDVGVGVRKWLAAAEHRLPCSLPPRSTSGGTAPALAGSSSAPYL